MAMGAMVPAPFFYGGGAGARETQVALAVGVKKFIDRERRFLYKREK